VAGEAQLFHKRHLPRVQHGHAPFLSPPWCLPPKSQHIVERAAWKCVGSVLALQFWP
jgi:hypothetical protein